MSWKTYRTVEHILPLVPTLFDVTLQGTRIEGFEEFKTAQQLGRD
jgi:hypothetical protein